MELDLPSGVDKVVFEYQFVGESLTTTLKKVIHGKRNTTSIYLREH
jgi:hypothetical protein